VRKLGGSWSLIVVSYNNLQSNFRPGIWRIVPLLCSISSLGAAVALRQLAFALAEVLLEYLLFFVWSSLEDDEYAQTRHASFRVDQFFSAHCDTIPNFRFLRALLICFVSYFLLQAARFGASTAGIVRARIVNRDFFSCSTFISVPPFWAEVRTTQSFAQVAVLPTRAALIFTIVPSLTHPAAASTYLLAV
jgi:hypothetical protein